MLDATQELLDLDFSIDGMRPAAPTGHMKPRGKRYLVKRATKRGAVAVAKAATMDQALAVCRRNDWVEVVNG